MDDTQQKTNGEHVETTDQKIDRLAVAMKGGFDAVDQKIDSVDQKIDSVDQKIDRLAVAVKEGFDSVDQRFGAVEQRLDTLEEKTTRIEVTMVTKSYLDDKLADLKGDLIVKMRKLEGGLLFLATVLRQHHVLSDEDVERMRTEYQVFPTLERT